MPAMSRKTYIAVAEAIRDTRPATHDPAPGQWSGRQNACEELAERMADIFAADNPRFDRTRFRAATERT